MSRISSCDNSPTSILFSKRRLFKNVLYNFVGQAFPLIIGILSIPYMVQQLGTEQFGILTLVWMVMGYFSLFDLGLGRATTKFVAEVWGQGKPAQIPSIVWTSVTAQLILGCIGGAALASVTPWLTTQIFKISFEVLPSAQLAFYFSSVSLPIVLVSGSFRGVLEALQRFDVVNLIKGSASSLSYLLPVGVLLLGGGLVSVVALLVFVRLVGLICYIIADITLVPMLRQIHWKKDLLKMLFSFGGWITVSSIIGPLLVYADRFLISILFSVAMITYYVVPYEAITRLWIIPISLTTTLFPAFSTLWGGGEKQKVQALFAKAIRYTLLSLGPIVFLLFFFAKPILMLWMGEDFAQKSAVVMGFLSIGVLLNSLARIPSAFIQGIGKPDIQAKFLLAETPFYIVLAWLSIKHWGIVGAAGAWSLRALIDAILLYVASLKMGRLSLSFKQSAKVLALLGFLLLGLLVSRFVSTLWPSSSWAFQSVGLLVSLAGFVVGAWRYVLEQHEKEILIHTGESLWKRVNQ